MKTHGYLVVYLLQYGVGREHLCIISSPPLGPYHYITPTLGSGCGTRRHAGDSRSSPSQARALQSLSFSAASEIKSLFFQFLDSMPYCLPIACICHGGWMDGWMCMSRSISRSAHACRRPSHHCRYLFICSIQPNHFTTVDGKQEITILQRLSISIIRLYSGIGVGDSRPSQYIRYLQVRKNGAARTARAQCTRHNDTTGLLQRVCAMY